MSREKKLSKAINNLIYAQNIFIEDNSPITNGLFDLCQDERMAIVDLMNDYTNLDDIDTNLVNRIINTGKSMKAIAHEYKKIDLIC